MAFNAAFFGLPMSLRVNYCEQVTPKILSSWRRIAALLKVQSAALIPADKFQPMRNDWVREIWISAM